MKRQGLEALVSDFKNSNEEYLEIKQAAEEKVKSVLNDGKILLKFATASVIESLRRNSELCNFVLNDTDIAYYGSNDLSLILPGQQQQQQSFSYLNDDIYAAVILEEAGKLYNGLTTKLANEVISASAAAVRTSSKAQTLRK